MEIKFLESLKKQRTNLPEQIAECIEETIAAEGWRVGTRLPPDRELAKLFEVTTVTVAKALTLLEERGLLVRKVGSGTFLNAIPESVIGASIRRYWAFKSCTFEDLFQLREILEPDAAARAAQRATREEIQELREWVERIEKSVIEQSLEGFATSDAAFHKAIAVSSGNQLYLAVIGGLHEVMTIWIQKKAEQLANSMNEKTIRIHWAIYNAIRDREVNGARCAMIDHMESSRVHLHGEDRNELLA